MPRFKRLALLVALRHAAAGTTSDYARPSRARDLRAHEVGCAYTNTAPTTPDDDLFRGFACDSQAHISYASPTSAILSYVTPDAVPSQLRYKRRDQLLWRTAVGDARSYTALANVDPQLWAPTMGDPSYSLDEVRAAANTTSWAVPGSASRRAPPFPRWLQSYNDPAMIYSSPVIHTVTLTDLVPGELYEYELEDGKHAFRLAPATYPIRLGLAADVGQTVASCVILKFTARSTPARWRGGVGSSPIDGSSAPDTLVDFHTGRVEPELCETGCIRAGRRTTLGRPVLRGRLALALGLARTRRPSIVQLDFPGDGVTAETPSTRHASQVRRPRLALALARPGPRHRRQPRNRVLRSMAPLPRKVADALPRSALDESVVLVGRRRAGPRRRAEQLRQLC